jgi:hypothetical protein
MTISHVCQAADIITTLVKLYIAKICAALVVLEVLEQATSYP